jgi:hypothetical protein
MAMNWGAFAGGAANSALGTYSQLNSERMKNLQTALFMEDMADKQKIKQGAAETFGRVGTDQYENINSILEAKGAEVSPEAMAIEKPAAPVKYTEQQAATDFGQKLSAIDPVRGFQFKGQALQYKSSKRQSDIDDKYDELTKWRNNALTTGLSTLEGKGMSGMPDILNPQLKKMGVTVEYKGSENGPGSLVAKDAEGKIVGTYTGLDQVKVGFKGLVAKEYESRMVGLLGSADKALTYALQREKLEVDKAKAQSEIAKNQAMAGAYTSSANSLGAPIGTDSKGAPVYQSRSGPVYGDGTKADPKAELTPWTQQRNFTPQAVTQNVKVRGEDGKERLMPVQIVSTMGRDNVPKITVYDLSGNVVSDPSVISQIGAKQDRINTVKQNALDYGEMMFESGAINPATKKPFASLEEAQKYAMGVALKDPSQAADAKQLTELEKIMLPKWPEAIASLGPKATQAQLIEMARKMGIRPELVNLPPQTQTSTKLGGIPNVGVDQGGLGSPGGTPKPAPGDKESPPTSAIPKEKRLSVGEQNKRKFIEEVEKELPNLTPERAREIKASRGYYTVLPKKLRDQVEAVIKSSEPPPRMLYSPR